MIKQKRIFDFYTISFFSSIIYFSPGFFGFVQDQEGFGRFRVEIAETTMQIMVFVLLGIIFSAIIYDKLVARKVHQKSYFVLRSSRYMVEVLFVFMFIFASIKIATSHNILWGIDKSLILQDWGRTGTGWVYATTLGVIASVCFNRPLYIFLFLVSAILILFIGHRTPIVWTAIGFSVVLLSRHGKIHLYKKINFRILFSSVFFLIFIFVIKKSYLQIKEGNWEVLINYFVNYERLLELVFFKSEPFLTQAILNKVVIYEFTVPPEHFLKLFAIFVPIFYTPEGATFNEYYQPTLFANVDAGLASNIWAEMWASGGWIALSVFLLFYVIILGLLSRCLIQFKDPAIKALIVMTGVIWAFYIHRNGIFVELIFIRRVLYFWFCAIICALLISRGATTKSRRKAREF